MRLAADNRMLGRFQLEGIRPAPRGVPQIEVTFDIDANGILNVTAKDKDTGAEQRITISESPTSTRGRSNGWSPTPRQHRSEDDQLRQRVDARNELDSRLPGRAPAGRPGRLRGRPRAGPRRDAGRRRAPAVKEEAPLDRVQSLTSELQQASTGACRPAGRQWRQWAQPGRRPTGPGGSGDDDVIDAEFDRG